MTRKVNGQTIEQLVYLAVGRSPFDREILRRLTGLSVADAHNALSRMQRKGYIRMIGPGKYERTSTPPRDRRGSNPGSRRALREAAKRRKRQVMVPVLASPLAQALAWEGSSRVDAKLKCVYSVSQPPFRPQNAADEVETEAQP